MLDTPETMLAILFKDIISGVQNNDRRFHDIMIEQTRKQVCCVLPTRGSLGAADERQRP